MVDFPLAERPVNQSVRPRWPRNALRSEWETEEGCQVIFLARGVSFGRHFTWILEEDTVGEAHLRRHGNPSSMKILGHDVFDEFRKDMSKWFLVAGHRC